MTGDRSSTALRCSGSVVDRRPRRNGPVLALCVAVAVVVVLAVTLWGRAGLTGGHRSESAAPGATGGSSRTLQTGVEVFSMWRDWPVNPQMLDRVAGAGSGWARVGVGWCSLEERGPGQVSTWYQDRLDSTVAEAERRGLKLLLTLGCTPSWAGASDMKVLPQDVSQYQRVAQYLAARYAGRVEAWELWNEPDCVTGTCGEQDPAGYLPVLRAGHTGIKAGDPTATVVTGGISGANADWIRRLYAAGGKGLFDALALHPYLGPAALPPEAPPTSHPYRMTNVEKVRQVMVEYGDAATPIWFTEFGWTTAPGTGWSAGVDEATQADYLRRAMTMVQHWYPYVTHAFWFTIRDRDDWTPYENSFGLLHLDGTPKPALQALRDTNTWLSTLQGRTTRIVTVAPAADTTARQAAPTKTAGGSTVLKSDAQQTEGVATTRATAYLRFVLPTLAPGESVAAAQLSLHATNPTVDGPSVWRTSTSWLESTLSWASGQPSRSATAPIGTFDEMTFGRTRTPVSGLPSRGSVSLQLHADSTDGLGVVSREGVLAQRPQLQLAVLSP